MLGVCRKTFDTSAGAYTLHTFRRFAPALVPTLLLVGVLRACSFPLRDCGSASRCILHGFRRFAPELFSNKPVGALRAPHFSALRT